MTSFVKRYRAPVAGVLALLGAFGQYRASMPRMLYAPVAAYVLSALFAVAAFFALNRLIEHANKRLVLFSAIGGALFALSLSVGTATFENYAAETAIFTFYNLLIAMLLWAAMFPSLTAMLAWCIEILPKARERLATGRAERCRMNPANCSGTIMFFTVWAILLVCWLPAYLGYFPGIYGYDMHNQNHQALTHLYNAYQPLLHTLLYEGCYRLGLALFGDGTGGVALYSAVQAVLLSGCLACVVTYLTKRLRVPFLITILSAVFYAVMPFHAIMAISSTKDTVFSGIFLLLLLQTYDLSCEPDLFLHSIKRCVLYLITALLACLLRNNMLYALAFAAVILIFGIKRPRVRAALLLIAVLAVSVLGGKALSGALDASAGPRTELLNVPIQQLATAHDRHAEEMTVEEKQAIYEYLPEELLGKFYPLLSDPIKFEAQIGDGLPSIKGFLTVWAKELPGYFGDYVDSFLTMTLGYWYPDETLHAHIYDGYDEPGTEETLGYMYSSFIENINPNVKKHSVWPAAERYYQWFTHENRHQSVPVLSTLMSPGIYCWLLFAALLAFLYYGKMQLVWALSLLYGVWLTLLLGPCTLIRYAYPIMASAPLIIGLMFNQTESDALKPPEKTDIGSGDNRGLEMLRFAVAGAVGFVIDYGVMVVLVQALSMHYLVATGLAFLLSVIVNYLMCVYWVFKGADRSSRGVQAGFILTSLIGLGLNELFMLLFVDVLHIHYAIAKLIAVALVMIWNYISKRKVLVKQKKEAGEAK